MRASETSPAIPGPSMVFPALDELAVLLGLELAVPLELLLVEAVPLELLPVVVVPFVPAETVVAFISATKTSAIPMIGAAVPFVSIIRSCFVGS